MQFCTHQKFFQQLIGNLDRDLQFAITVEGKMSIESIANYEDVNNAIMEKVLFFTVFFLFNAKVSNVTLMSLFLLYFDQIKCCVF